MNHITRTLFLALATFVFAAPAAWAVNNVGGTSGDVPPGASTVGVDISNDADLRGVGFKVVLQNISATSATLGAITVNLAELPSRHIVGGDVFLAGRDGVDD